MRGHIRRMQAEGWAAKNAERGLAMFACSEGKGALECFKQRDRNRKDVFPEAQSLEVSKAWANPSVPGAKLRVLTKLNYGTSYWMRTSPDGRFVGNGATEPPPEGAVPPPPTDACDPLDVECDSRGREQYYNGRFTDLQPVMLGQPARDIYVTAEYDPAFFPDNSGFMFQGTPKDTGFCRIGILGDPATKKIDFSEPRCAAGRQSIGLYQAVGASLDGSDYVAAAGDFLGDDGGGYRADEDGTWFETSYLNLSAIINDGQNFRTLETVTLWTPFLAEWNLSPSTELAVGHISGVDAANAPKQMGYSFKLLKKTKTADGYQFELKDAATVCLEGGKPGISFDERMFVTFHYVDADDFAELGFASADDPAFRALVDKGASNVYIRDLLTGATKRITTMGPGQFAMFPHFRSDGWIYFQAYDQKSNSRYVVASDAAIRLQRSN
jgi:hypothetical protein